jgi:hypothetical protein
MYRIAISPDVSSFVLLRSVDLSSSILTLYILPLVNSHGKVQHYCCHRIVDVRYLSSRFHLSTSLVNGYSRHHDMVLISKLHDTFCYCPALFLSPVALLLLALPLLAPDNPPPGALSFNKDWKKEWSTSLCFGV